MPPISRVKHSESLIASLPQSALQKVLATDAQANHVAIYGYSDQNVGIYGGSDSNIGVYGTSNQGTGVQGEVDSNGIGVAGRSASGVGVWGESDAYEAMHAETHSPTTAAIAAYNLNPNATGAGVYAKSAGKGPAGFFDGDVYVSKTIKTDGDIQVGGNIILSTGDVILMNAADCAEEFEVDLDSLAEPGTVMVLSGERRVSASAAAYDTRVAGVISGAGSYKPGIVLDRQPARANRRPIALLGKVYCKVDASFGAVSPGDLLTTSPTPGHAMRVADPLRAVGAVLGKALASLAGGCDLVPVLVTLR